MFPTGQQGLMQPFTQPIHTDPGKRFARKQHGFWEQRQGLVEYLLCHDCEQKISTFEDYAKRFLYGGSDPIRLSLPLLPEPVFAADYKNMKLFQLSILWRAAEAKGEFFSAVTLTPFHRERLRQMLLSEDPGAEYEFFCTMIRLVPSPAVESLQSCHGISIETGTFAPVAHDAGTWQSYTFVMGGIVWAFCISESGRARHSAKFIYETEWTLLAVTDECRSFFDKLFTESRSGGKHHLGRCRGRASREATTHVIVRFELRSSS
jgi:hypothetical protein